jgi:hypothetical protein
LAALAVFEVIIGRVTERGHPHFRVGGYNESCRAVLVIVLRDRKPHLGGWAERPKAEALGYLEAKRRIPSASR